MLYPQQLSQVNISTQNPSFWALGIVKVKQLLSHTCSLWSNFLANHYLCTKGILQFKWLDSKVLRDLGIQNDSSANYCYVLFQFQSAIIPCTCWLSGCPPYPLLWYLVDQFLRPLSLCVLLSQCRCPIQADTGNQQVTPIRGACLCEQFIVLIVPTVSAPGSLFSSRHQLPTNWAICMRLFCKTFNFLYLEVTLLQKMGIEIVEHHREKLHLKGFGGHILRTLEDKRCMQRFIIQTFYNGNIKHTSTFFSRDLSI